MFSKEHLIAHTCITITCGQCIGHVNPCCEQFLQKVKKVRKEEEEWIGEEIQVTRKQIKQHEERKQIEEKI